MVQIFVSKKVLEEGELKTIFQKVLQDFKRPNEEWNPFVSVMNTNLAFVFLEVKRVVSEEDSKTYWGLVNTKGDNGDKIATSFNSSEIALFKKIVEAIVVPETEDDEPPGSISQIDAVNLAKGNGISLQAAEKAIKRMVKEQWLSLSEDRNSKLSLGIRTFLELKSWLENSFQNSLRECVVCSEPVLKGDACPNTRCKTRMHKHCSRRWFQPGKETKCPSCNTPWR